MAQAPSWLILLLSFHVLTACCAQSSISTTITVPPLQWINLTNHISSGTTSPPALRDAVIGYDDPSRTLIVFGGQSEGGNALDTTYLLNLDTLVWSVPSPPDSLDRKPAPRSGAVGGYDSAASYRQGFVVIGGKGSDGKALSDVWEYDFNNQFWSQVQVSTSSPNARWGAVGGTDIRVTVDPVDLHNTLYLAGGDDGTDVFSFSDIWRLNISGTLASNTPDGTTGSWDRFSIDGLPSRTGAGGTMLFSQVIAVGGCDSVKGGSSCVQQDSYIMKTATLTDVSPSGCPVPRSNPVLVANVNTFSTSFASQAFLLLGTFNDTLWSDGGNLAKGEVAVLDTDAGIWSRVLPSGDPGTTGTEAFPSPRQGASAFAFKEALVGGSRTTASDIIIFGGQDASGQYLSEVWILRSYDGTITSSETEWSGYGTGDLETGVNAAGTHVSVQILSECASALSSAATSATSASSHPSSTTSASSPPTGTQSQHTGGPSSNSVPLYDTSVYHKILAPLSLAIFLPAVVLLRLFSSTYTATPRSEGTMRWMILSGLLTAISYGMGVAAIALAFATTKPDSSSITKRSTSSTLLKTTHARISLAFFIGLYAFVPIILLLLTCSRRSDWLTLRSGTTLKRNSTELAEKLGSTDVGSSREPIADYPEPSRSPSPRMRTPSFGTSGGLLRPSNDDRRSTDSESIGSAAPQRGFEILNRPSRHHKSNSSNYLSPIPIAPQQAQRNLAEMDWLQRRRSLNAVDELDYAITQHIRAQQHPSNATDVQPAHLVTLPLCMDVAARALLHFFLIGLCIISLVALWSRAPRVTFGVFLAWIVAMYAIIVYLSWIGKPPMSTLTVIFLRLRSTTAHPPTSTPTLADTRTPPQGPYLHQPSHRPAPDRQDSSLTYTHGPRSTEDDVEEEDEDEDITQQRIEREMERREVSIVTVPKRRLWITNPES